MALHLRSHYNVYTLSAIMHQLCKYNIISQAFFEKSGATETTETTGDSNKLIVAITSDRGLCGAVHTNVSKIIRNELSVEAPEAQTKVFCVGDKSRALLQRYKKNVHNNI